MKILILTEKPSQARDFAKALGNCKQKEGYYDCGKYIITWAVGHLFEIDDSVAPTKWSLETLPIYPEKFKLKLRRGGGKQFKIIKGLLRGSDSVILASVGYDEPILIFDGEKPIFTSVGEFVDRFFDTGCSLLRFLTPLTPTFKTSVNTRANNGSFREDKILPKRFYCLAFDKEGKVKLRPIKGVVRHKADLHRLYRIKTSYGREIIASEHHSFFVLKDGKPRPVETKKLSVGDEILVPANINLPEREIVLDLLKEFINNGSFENIEVESKCLESFLIEIAVEKVDKFFGKVAVFDTEGLKKIKQKRLKLGISQAKLAELIGVVQSAISLFESGKSNLKVEKAQKLLDILGLKIPFDIKVDGRVQQVQKLVSKTKKSRKATTRGKRLLSVLNLEILNFLLKNCTDLTLSLKGTNSNKTKFSRFLKLD
ncbi:MAG: helix-turn-helix domain-containing protein, partial [Aquificae bacterium]|nr:helix-turn-helix domain-containing protein [Aquificota bacterium]